MKRFAIALVFACALSGTALAGDVPSTGNPAPVPVAGNNLDDDGNQGAGGWALMILDLFF